MSELLCAQTISGSGHQVSVPPSATLARTVSAGRDPYVHEQIVVLQQ